MLDDLPNALKLQGFSEQRCRQYRLFIERFTEALASTGDANLQQQLKDKTSLRDAFFHVTAHSEFAQTQLTRHPGWLLPWSKTELNVPLTQSDYVAHCKQHLCHATDLDSFNRCLREFRNRGMVGIIWRDFQRLVATQQTTAELTWLAENCIQQALNFHQPLLVEKHGEPRDNQATVQPMLVLGMGKLGAAELNLSSDIDLIFAYPTGGETIGGRKPVSNQEFFNQLGKAVIKSLDSNTVDGFVFRVDMRLRPFGQSGALVSHFDALEDYYQTQGREWERYAMIKARVVANSLPNSETSHQAVNELNDLIRHFTYRRYVDFSVVAALRDLKHKINQEVVRRRLGNDIKLGSGGIREVEFIAQSFQLIRGGRDIELQDNRLLTILALLEQLNCLPAGKAQALSDAYLFLRNAEHAIQGFQDRQTQKLPTDADQQLSIARVMGFESWDQFASRLEQLRTLVKTEFAAVIASPEEKGDDISSDCDWGCIWADSLEPDAYLTLLQEHKHEDPIKSLEQLEALRISSNVITMQPAGRKRLDKFMPRLLAALSNTEAPTETLRRVLLLVKAVARRSAYLLLLIENPGALKQLVLLSAASPWIALELAARPALLDELLDPRTLYQAPDKHALVDELRRVTLRIPEDDLEDQMEALRYYRSAHALRVAACEISGALPLMKVSDYLTWLAETLLDYVLLVSWQQLTAKHGFPDGQEITTPPFLIVGYGKLGGIELGHGSDLDLVFIHNANPMGTTDGQTRGLKSLDNQTFFMRLGQKIIHMLNTRMASGELYEVDMRLRPSGNSGMLVTTLPAFEKYQRSSAWTWEHQALIRARAVAGDPTLAQQFNDVRQRILCLERDQKQLHADVLGMRKKMQKQLGSGKDTNPNPLFHLKQDRGGIVDIEFMVQYAVLAWAQKVPALTQYTDNIRILESFAHSNLMSTQEVEQLISAYKALRSLGHRLTLQQQSNLIEVAMLDEEVRLAREQVATLWENTFPA